MSDSIMRLVDEYARGGPWSRNAIEQAVAELRARAERAPCGHPLSLTVKSVESDETVCEFCDVRSQRDDAVAMEASLQQRIADLEAQAQRRPALEAFNEFCLVGGSLNALERLRAFCSFAMSGQDWPDVEQFFDACEARERAYLAAGKVLAEFTATCGELQDAHDVFTGQPGALERWMAKEER